MINNIKMMNIELNFKLSNVLMMYKNGLQATHSTISVTCEVWRSIDRVRQAFAAANHQPADSVHGESWRFQQSNFDSYVFT